MAQLSLLLNEQKPIMRIGRMIQKSKNRKQDDRLLKRLPLEERRKQELLRKLIINDQLFKSA